MSGEFLETTTLDDAYEVIRTHVPLGTSAEIIPLDAVLGRITVCELQAPEDLPLFVKSTVDGYAVRAADTFGASEGTPIYLEVLGEVTMGSGKVMDPRGKGIPRFSLPHNAAIRIPTGGMLPEGADGVVMVEYTQPCQGEKGNVIEVTRAVAPGENVIQRGEDIRKGESLFPKGHQLRPQDIGILAGLGMTTVAVFRRPSVAILSTGPEVCPVDRFPEKGKVRDINAYTLAAVVRESGGEPRSLGICPDDPWELRERVGAALTRADCVLISGGSSVGTRDYTFQVITDLGPPGVLVHGLSIRPGKPTIIGQSGTVPIIGLPGHPASAMVVAHAIVRPLVHRLSGLCLSPLESTLEHSSHTLTAVLTRNVPSSPGKEDFMRVALTEREGRLLATPLFGKSGLISPLIKAHGMFRIPADAEGAYEGDEIEVRLF
ncbi:MAG: gephyrin-like molybdotransferase Glp [bacterium]